MADSTRPCINCGESVTGGPSVECGKCGHRQSWRTKKQKTDGGDPAPDAKGVAEARARAREEAALIISEAVQSWLVEPLPSPGALLEEMLSVLRGIAKAEGVPVETKDRVAASSKAADICMKRINPAEELRRVFGDPRKALAFIRAAVPQLEAEIASEEKGAGRG